MVTARTSSSQRGSKAKPKDASVPAKSKRYCALPQMPQRVLAPNVIPDRARLILVYGDKWVNGTVLRYYFFDKPTDGEKVLMTNGASVWQTWTASKAQKDVVRKAFQMWKDVGIGLEFKEVASRDEAEIRIGFMQTDGSWSYIGRQILTIGRDQRTMNFGWDLTLDPDTAVHEIGHTLGFPHEHQNPKAGIVWNEEAVYASLAAPPNNWSREMTFENIIRKIPVNSVRGSTWDPDSIMEYPFEAGLIKEPAKYQTGLQPAGGLSAWDKSYAKTFYPPMKAAAYPALKPFRSVPLALVAGEQKDFSITPTETRYYEIRTFGTSDTVMALFEEVDGELRYKTADDDSGEDRNAYIKLRLFKDKKYVLRVRMYYADRVGETAAMMW